MKDYEKMLLGVGLILVMALLTVVGHSMLCLAAWLFQNEASGWSVVLSLIVGVFCIINFIIRYNKTKKFFNIYNWIPFPLLIVMLIITTWISGTIGNYAEYHGEYLTTYSDVYNKFGFKIFSGSNLRISKDGFFVYEGNEWSNAESGRVFSLIDKRVVLPTGTSIETEGKVVEGENGLYGIVSYEGYLLVPYKYDYINFEKGYAIVNRGAFYGVLTKTGEPLLDVEYNNIRIVKGEKKDWFIVEDADGYDNLLNAIPHKHKYVTVISRRYRIEDSTESNGEFRTYATRDDYYNDNWKFYKWE